MEAVSTGFNIRFPSKNTFNASPPITSIPPCTTSMFLQQYPHRSFPRLSFIQRPHVFEKARTSSRRQPRGIVCSMKKLAQTEAIPLEENPKSLAEKLPYATGVYAMHDKSGELQFIGISRMVADSVLNHLRDVPQLCGSVKIALVDVPDRTALTDAWKVWMEEHINAIGKIPPGNESGSTIWVKKRQTKPDLRLTPGRHVQLTVTLEQLIDKLVKENEIVVFIKGSRMAPQCGFSHKVLTILNEHGLDYESVNILDEDYNPGLRETLKVYSSWPTFPQVFIKGEFVGGADILTEMAEKGELQECLKSKK